MALFRSVVTTALRSWFLLVGLEGNLRVGILSFVVMFLRGKFKGVAYPIATWYNFYVVRGELTLGVFCRLFRIINRERGFICVILSYVIGGLGTSD